MPSPSPSHCLHCRLRLSPWSVGEAFSGWWEVKPIFLAGPNDDASPFQAHTVWRGDLEAAKTLVSNAAFFIGNDSGPAHLAAAFGRPTVVLFGPSNPAIWSPWRTESEVVVAPDGLNNVNVSRVIAALERLRVFEKAHA